MITSSCSMTGKFESAFDSREIELEGMNHLIAPVNEFEYATSMISAEATLEGKTHDIVATIDVHCYDKSNYDMFDRNENALQEAVKEVFKAITYDELMNLEDYQHIELRIKLKLVEKLSIESKKLYVEITDVDTTER